MRFKKTSFLTKLLLLIVAVYAVYTLVRLQDRIQIARQTVSDLEAQVVYAEQDNAQLEQDLKDIDSDRSVKSIARNRLGMVEAGEIVFRDADMHD
ncbi:MAG: septum formation initiator family protein [Oscillospiraceae bacterium]|nr:septum formation initiator family protein [Oscillospiraceae bacterium]MBQ1755699.1 septum formation initiator family protein [Oscillospiraceae bacterium]MBQ2143569.1 septum formation initiator family protein [Oscillospiraceae bacterium]MBQ5468249.1 septum formation initiator family protein [Oscillospiraceae bacterium]MBQ6281750.1 septum formation initiator family protein [Oscillospiraceae bacterium]